MGARVPTRVISSLVPASRLPVVCCSYAVANLALTYLLRSACHVCLLICCSTWFADRFWSLLGLPEARLHTLYQAALAPVRLLWHVLPSYQQLYAKVEQQYGIAATVPNLTEFVAILAWVLGDVATQSGFLMATTATMALVASFAVSAKKSMQRRHTSIPNVDCKWLVIVPQCIQRLNAPPSLHQCNWTVCPTTSACATGRTLHCKF